MIIDCILTACNNNPLYEEFIPIFIKAWNKILKEADVKIVYVNDSIPDHLRDFESNLILFKPPSGISSAFISQHIRNLYPCILPYSNGVLITDMDMIPLNKVYYTENIKEIDNTNFVYYRDALIDDCKEIAMCYNVAVPTVWKEIFNIHSIDDVYTNIINVNKTIKYSGIPGQSGWATDQEYLYKCVMEWNSKSGRFLYLKDSETGYKRLCRVWSFRHGLIATHVLKDIIEDIKAGKYSDYHMLRPYSRFKKINDAIVDLL